MPRARPAAAQADEAARRRPDTGAPDAEPAREPRPRRRAARLTVLVTRIAPTPSGFLHVGNAVNMVLTHWLARAHDGRLLLRIDDFDTGRARAAYLEDVFRTLDWLGIDIDDGPSRARGLPLVVVDVHAHRPVPRGAGPPHAAAGHDTVFVCRCSRHDLDVSGRCVAGCRAQDLTLEPGRSALRMSVPGGSARGLPLPPATMCSGAATTCPPTSSAQWSPTRTWA